MIAVLVMGVVCLKSDAITTTDTFGSLGEAPKEWPIVWQMEPSGLDNIGGGLKGRWSPPPSAGMNLRPLFVSSLPPVACRHASPFVTLSSPPHLKADPQGSQTKHAKQGADFFFSRAGEGRQGWRAAKNDHGLVLVERTV